jgi:hypothetical protein
MILLVWVPSKSRFVYAMVRIKFKRATNESDDTFSSKVLTIKDRWSFSAKMDPCSFRLSRASAASSTETPPA